ncbi:hypothetical protein UAY_00712 [Enterococcus moraviensis ATCC BAA-383]|uniref:DUF2304 domain-containing protein n=1 Tax=Enterococcus moraviensis ATCC BAA-383 TaxID=1158609 RepID=R2R7P5_9ENTE|nr:DUF2304 domain-containing protein [Enterococcus moraviensis]EOI04940.1 hypothetical protein UAY_00712 [Enterococcus moraviensis ATCC BAA-383]EOT74155.1 hypothetical protein I586_01153 [Enterococcus moraviensis ATCC BAA-383]
MSAVLRIELLLFSLLFFVYIIRSVNKNIFLLKNAIRWLFISASLVLCAIFPKLPEWLGKKLGFETTSNFLLIAAIFVLLFIEIKNSALLSKQQNQLKLLIQELSMLKDKKEKK